MPTPTSVRRLLTRAFTRRGAAPIRRTTTPLGRGIECLEDRSVPATLTWVGDQDANWNTNNAGNTNWSGDALPASGDTLVFAGAAVGTLTNNTTAGNVYALQFTADGYTITGNAITLNEATTGTAFAIQLTTGQAIVGVDLTLANTTNTIDVQLPGGPTPLLSLGGVVSGGGGNELVKTSDGQLDLTNGGNTYAGQTTINAGNLVITADGALGTAAGGTRVNGGAGGTLLLNNVAYATAEPLVLNGGNLWPASGTNSFAGPVTLLGDSFIFGDSDLTFTGTVDTDAAGPALGAQLRVVPQTAPSAGTITFANTVGATRPLSAIVQDAGASAITFQNNVTLDTGSTTFNASVTLQNMTFTSAGNVAFGDAATDALTISGVASTISVGTGSTGTITAGTTLTGGLTLGGAGDFSVSGVVSGGGALTKTGTGTATLFGTNTYTGATTVSAGTLVAASAAALGTTAAGTTVIAGATLDVGANIGTEAVSLGGSLVTSTGTGTVGGAVTLTAGANVGGAGTLNVTGAIGGAFGVTKVGTGTTSLSGTNTHAGTTGVSAGTLALASGAAIPDAGAVTVAGGATLRLDASETIGSLAGAGAVNLQTFTLTTGGDNTSTSFSGAFSGTSGSLAKAGTGTFTVAGTSTIAGALTVQNGTLDAGGANLAVGAVSITGGTLAAPTNTMTVAGNWSRTGGTFNPNGGTVDFTAVVQTVNGGGEAFNNLTKSGVGLLTLVTSPLTVNGNLSVNAGSLVLAGRDLTVNGTVSNTASIFAHGSETVTLANGNDTDSGGWIFQGNNTAGPFTIPDFGAVDYFILTIADGNATPATFRAAAPLAVASVFEVGNTFGGTYDANGNTTTVAGLTTVAAGTYLASTTAQNLNGGLTVQSGAFTGSTGAVATTDLTLTGGTLTAPSTTLSVTGNWLRTGGTFAPNGGTVDFTAAAGTQTLDSGGAAFASVTHSGAGTLQLTGSALTVAADLTNSSGTFDLAGLGLTVGGIVSVANGSTVQLQGTEAVSLANGNDTDTGTWRYVGNGAAGPLTVSDFGGVDYWNLVVASGPTTMRLGAGLNVARALTVSAGTLDPDGQTVDTATNTLAAATVSGGTYLASTAPQAFNGGLSVSAGAFTGSTGTVTTTDLTLTGGTLTAPSTTLSVSGTFGHAAGAFTANGGTVVLTGTGQALTGATTFNNLTKTAAAADTLTFGPGLANRTTVTGTLTLQGAAGQLLSLRSATPGTQWEVDPQGARVIDFVDVQDSNNVNPTAITPTNAVDAGSNTNWTFGTATATIVGTDLVIADAAGVANGLAVRLVNAGADVEITDATQAFDSAPGAGVLSNGNRTLTIPLAAFTGRLVFTTGGGADTLTVDQTVPIPRAIDFDGGPQADTLTLTGGTFAAVTHNMTGPADGNLVFSGVAGTITYTGLEPVDTTGTTATDLVFNLPAAASVAVLEDFGGAGDTFSQLRSANGTFELTQFANPTGSLTVNRGNAADTLTIDALPDFSAALTVGAGATPFADVTATAALGPIASLTVAATAISLQAVTTAGGQAYTGATTLNGDLTTTSGAVAVTGVTTLGAAVAVTTAGAQDVTFTGTVDGAFGLTVSSDGATTFGGVVGGGAALTTLTTDAAGTTAITADVTTTGTQTYDDTATLAGAATLTSTGGGDISFGGTLDGAFGLTINTAGGANFSGAVGGTTPLTSLTTDTPGLTRLAADLTTTGGQDYGDQLALFANVVLTSTGGGTLSFAQIDNNFTLAVNTAGATAFTAAVGGTAALASLTTDAGGTTAVAAGVTTASDQVFNDAVTASGAPVFASPAGGAVTFASTLDGATAVAVNTAGVTTFGGAVGGVTPLSSLTTDAGGTTAVAGGAVTTTGGQLYGDPVTLGAAATLASTGGGTIAFAAAVDGAFALATSTTGATTFAAAVGGTAPLTTLGIAAGTMTAADIATTTGVTVTNTGAASITGVVSGAASTLDKQGAGTLTLTGANAYGGATTITAGRLDVTGSVTSSLTVTTPGTLGGTGTVTGNVTGTGTVAPGTSPGVLTVVGNFTPTGTVAFEVDAPAAVAGTDHDQIVVTGTVDLSGATLAFTGTAGAVAPNLLVSLVLNDLADPTVAAATPAQGATVTIGGVAYRVFYNGGDGNDVVLVEATTPATVYVDDDFTQSPGQTIADADLGTAGNQPGVFGVTAFATIADALAAVAAGGTVVVNAGTYAEAVTLTGATAATLRVTGPDAPGVVAINSLATAAGTTVQLDGPSGLTIGDATDTTVAGVIAGPGGGTLSKAGTGVVTLAATNTYTGATQVAAGTLVATAPAALGAPAAGTTVATGATLDVRANIGTEAIALAGSLVTGAGTGTVGGAVTLTADASVGGVGTLTINGAIGGGFAVTKVGAGDVVLTAANTYIGPTAVTNGRLVVDGVQAASAVSVTGGTLGGGGTIGALTAPGGTVAPGRAAPTTPVTLTAGDTSFGATTFAPVVAGTPGGGSGTLAVVGTVTLAGTTLAVTRTGAPAAAGQTFTLIANDGTDAVTGTFAGLPEGSVVTVGGQALRLSYTGGTGNDVTLTPVVPMVAGGSADGNVSVFTAGANGQFGTPTAVPIFSNSSASVRATTGDVNGDGTPDLVAVTGPGVPIRVTVLSGVDNATVLVPAFDPFGGNFTGGGFVAAADLDGDGGAEFVVTPDQGGGPRVVVLGLNPDGTVAARASFFGIDDPAFRGGARAALGDVNGDGTPDLAVAAGFLGGPRAALFDGTTLLGGSPTRLVNDFFAFPGPDAVTLRNGAFVAISDLDGDGFGELVFGGGPGGAPRVFALSGARVSTGDVEGAQAAPVANFFVAGDSNDRGGARVAAADIDGDGRADLAVGSGANRPAKVRVYPGKTFTGAGEPAGAIDLDPFGGAVLADGVYVG
jgi:autotransporter-associated beta strand protein